MPSRLTAVNSRAPCLGADQKARGLWEREMENFSCLSPVSCLSWSFKRPGFPGLPRVSKKMAADPGQVSGSFLQTNFRATTRALPCHVLAPDNEHLLQHECVRNSCLFEAFLPVHVSRVKCCMNKSENFPLKYNRKKKFNLIFFFSVVF